MPTLATKWLFCLEPKSLCEDHSQSPMLIFSQCLGLHGSREFSQINVQVANVCGNNFCTPSHKVYNKDSSFCCCLLSPAIWPVAHGLSCTTEPHTFAQIQSGLFLTTRIEQEAQTYQASSHKYKVSAVPQWSSNMIHRKHVVLVQSSDAIVLHSTSATSQDYSACTHQQAYT